MTITSIAGLHLAAGTARVGLALLLLVSAVAKAMAPLAAVHTLLGHGLTLPLAGSAIASLCGLEAACGVALLWLPTRRTLQRVGVVSLALLVGHLWFAGPGKDCGCHGRFELPHALVSAVLAAGVVACWLGGGGNARRAGRPLAAAARAVALTMAVGCATWAWSVASADHGAVDGDVVERLRQLLVSHRLESTRHVIVGAPGCSACTAAIAEAQVAADCVVLWPADAPTVDVGVCRLVPVSRAELQRLSGDELATVFRLTARDVRRVASVASLD